MNILLFYI